MAEVIFPSPNVRSFGANASWAVLTKTVLPIFFLGGGEVGVVGVKDLAVEQQIEIPVARDEPENVLRADVGIFTLIQLGGVGAVGKFRKRLRLLLGELGVLDLLDGGGLGPQRKSP